MRTPSQVSKKRLMFNHSRHHLQPKKRNFFQKFAFFDRVAAAPVDAETDWTEIAFLPKKHFYNNFFRRRRLKSRFDTLPKFLSTSDDIVFICHYQLPEEPWSSGQSGCLKKQEDQGLIPAQTKCFFSPRVCGGRNKMDPDMINCVILFIHVDKK